MIKWKKYRYEYDWNTDKMIRHENIYRCPNNFDINDFIRKNKLKISSDYYNMVLSRNGGEIEENLLKEMKIDIKGKKQVIPSVFSVSRFLGFVDSYEEDIGRIFKKKYPKQKFLPIAMDTVNDLFFLDCSESNCGIVYYEKTDESIVYFDNSFNLDVDTIDPQLYKVANNFADFIELIQWNE